MGYTEDYHKTDLERLAERGVIIPRPELVSIGRGLVVVAGHTGDRHRAGWDQFGLHHH